MNKKIIIAGAGIGGLTTALALRSFGLKCQLFEASSEIGAGSGLGAGIQLTPNAMLVFKKLGVDKKLAELSFEPLGVALRNYHSGKPYLTIKTKNEYQRLYGAPYLHIHRSDLIKTLLDEVKLHNIPLHLNAAITDFTQSNNSIEIATSSGEFCKTDLLIGADGIHSVVRKKMFSAAPAARFTKQIAWRGFVKTDKLAKNTIPPYANIWLGKGKHFVAYYISGGSLINFVAVKEQNVWVKEDWKLKDNIENVRNAFKGWDSRIETLLNAASDDDCYLWGLHDNQPLSHWAKGRAILLGDACHPILPFMAQGAAMAIEDGFVLAKSLNTHRASINTALKSYEKIRKPRTAKIQKISNFNKKIYHLHFAPLLGLRNFAFSIARLLPRVNFDKIYGTDVTR